MDEIYLLIHCSVDNQYEEIEKRLKKYDELGEVKSFYGAYDVVAKTHMDQEKVGSFINKLKDQEKIDSVLRLVVIPEQSYKNL